MGVKHTITIPKWLDRVCAWPMMRYRKWKYGYTFRRIYLDEGKYTIVDQDDYYRFSRYKWSAVYNGNQVYAARIILEMEFGRIKTIFLHREIMNAPKGMLVDHKDNIGLDNRKDNLRLATHSENCCNHAKQKNTTSRYKGVHFEKRRGKWHARIKFNGKRIYLGSYDNEIDAGLAYDRAAIKYQGEFARLNFPDDAPSRACPRTS